LELVADKVIDEEYVVDIVDDAETEPGAVCDTERVLHGDAV